MTHLCTMSYTERAMDAERRLRLGAIQRYCAECGLWRWPDECTHAGRLTPQQFKAMSARIERQVRRDYPTQEDRYRQELRRALGQAL